MNQVDKAAFPVVCDMILGQPATLDATACKKIANWAAKIALNGRHCVVDPLPVDPAWTDFMYRSHSAPPGWQVVIGRYVGSHAVLYNAGNPHLAEGEPYDSSATLLRDTVVMTTFAIGELAVQVVGLPEEEGLVLTPTDSIPIIRPYPGTPVQWPPRLAMNDEWFNRFADRFYPTESKPD